MEWFTKIVNILKIPLKILLPSVSIFSGFLLFVNDDLLSKMNLLQWKNENGFIFGLLFLLSLSLIVAYITGFAINKVKEAWLNATQNKRILKRIKDLNDVEQLVLARIYNSPAYTLDCNFKEPIIKGLLERQFIYTGNSQLVDTIVPTYIHIKVTLYPDVLKAIDYYMSIIENNIDNCDKKIAKTSNKNKKEKLLEIRENMKYFNDLFLGLLFKEGES